MNTVRLCTTVFVPSGYRDDRHPIHPASAHPILINHSCSDITSCLLLPKQRPRCRTTSCATPWTQSVTPSTPATRPSASWRRGSDPSTLTVTAAAAAAAAPTPRPCADEHPVPGISRTQTETQVSVIKGSVRNPSPRILG
jgi:hypothetical protein